MKLAEAIVGKLKPELKVLLEGTEERLLERIASGKVRSNVAVAEAVEEVIDSNGRGVTAILADTQSGERTEKNAVVPAEKILSTQAIGFLKGLNDD